MTFTQADLTVNSTWTHWLLQTIKHIGLVGPDASGEFAELVNDAPSLALDIGRIRSVYHWIDGLANDPLLGVRLSQMIDQRALGVLSPLGWHAPNVREIVNILIRFYCLVSGNGDFDLIAPPVDAGRPGDLQIRYRPRVHSIPPNRHQSLLVTCTVLNSLRLMARNHHVVRTMGVPSTLDAEAIGQAVSCKTHPHDSDSELTLSIRGDLLDTAIGGRDDQLYSIVMNHAIARAREVNRYMGLSEDICQFVRSAGFSNADMLTFCEHNGLHPRELQRTLAEQGLSFRGLRQRETRDRALSMLIESSASISDIAATLGYSESASFARACNSWFDRSPSDIRKGGWIAGTLDPKMKSRERQ